MSQTIDNRIVEMQFDNKDFEKNVGQSLTTLDKLKSALKFDDAAKNLQDLNKAAKQVDLNTLNDSINSLADRFSLMRIAGITAFSELVKAALGFGAKIGSALMGPINQAWSGGFQRAANLENAQFKLEGILQDANKVKQAMTDVDNAVQGTAYSLDEAAVLASQFAASGVQVGDNMENALKSVVGVAAQTGSSFAEIGDIFNTINSRGKMTSMELNRLSVRGVNASAVLAKHFGTTEEAIREMVKKGQIHFKEFSDAMFEAFGDNAYKANDTFDGAMANMKSALNRIGADFFTPYRKGMIPIMNSMRLMYNGFKKELQPVVQDFTYVMESMAINVSKFLKGKNIQLGFREIVNIARSTVGNLLSVLVPVKNAINDIFPSVKSKNVVEFLRGINNIVQKLRLSSNALLGIEKIVKALLIPLKALFKIGSTIVTKVIMPFLGVAWKVLDFVLSFIGVVPEMIKQIALGVSKTETWTNFMEALGRVVNNVKNAFKALKTRIADAFKNMLSGERTSNSLLDILLKIASVIVWLGSLTIKGLTAGLNKLADFDFSNVIKGLRIFGESVKNVLRDISQFKAVQVVINVVKTAIGLLVLGVIKAVLAFKEFFDSIKGGVKSFDELREKFGAFVKNLFSFKDEFSEIDIDKNDKIVSKIDFIKKKFEDLKTSIGKILNYIKTNIGSIDASHVILIAFGAAVVATIFNISKAAKEFGGVSKSISGAIDKVSSAIASLVPKRHLSDEILKIAAAIAVLAVSIGGLALIDKQTPGGIKRVTLLLGGLFLAIAAMAASMMILEKYLGAFGKVKGLSSLGTFTTAIIALSGSVLVLAMSLKMMEDLNMEHVGKSILFLVSILGTMSLIAIALSRFSGDKEVLMNTWAMVGFATSIYMISKALKGLGEIDFANLSDHILELLGLMTAISFLAVCVGNIRFTSAVGMIILLLTLRAYLPLIKEIASTDFSSLAAQFEKHAKTILKMVTFFAAFILLSEIVLAFGGNRIASAAKTFFAIGVVAVAMAFAAKMFGQLTWSEFAKGIVGLSLVGTIMILLSRIIKADKLFGSTHNVTRPFIALGVVAIALAAAAKIFATLTVKGLLKAIVGLGVVGSLFAIMMVLMNDAGQLKGSGIGQMVVIIAAIATVVASIGVLSALIEATGGESVKTAFRMLIGILAMLAILAYVISDSLLVAVNSLKPQEVQKAAKKTDSFIPSLMAIIAAVGVITGGIALLAYTSKGLDNGVKDLRDIAIMLGIALITMAGIALVMQSFSSKNVAINNKATTDLIKIVTMLIASIAALTTALVVISTIPKELVWRSYGVLAALTGIIAGLMLFVEGMSIINKKRKVVKDLRNIINAGAVAILTACIIALAAIVKIITSELDDKGSVGKAVGTLYLLGGLVAALGAFSVWMSKMNKLSGLENVLSASSLAIVTACVAALALVVKMLVKELDNEGKVWEAVKIITALSVVAVGLVALLSLIGSLTEGIGSLAELAAGGAILLTAIAIMTFANAIKVLAEAPLEKLKPDLLIRLGVALAALVGIGLLGTLATAGLLGIAAALLALALAANGIANVVNALASLVAVAGDVSLLGVQLANGIANFITTLNERSGEISAAVVGIITSVLAAIAGAQGQILTFIGTIVTNIFNFLASYMPIFATLPVMLLMAILEVLTVFAPEIINTAGNWAVTTLKGVMAYIIAHQEELHQMFLMVVLGIFSFDSASNGAIVDFVKMCFEVFLRELQAKASAFVAYGAGLLADLIASIFGDGAVSEALRVGPEHAVESLKNNFSTGINNLKTWLIDKFKETIRNAVSGLEQGVEAVSGNITNIGSKMAKFFLGGWKDTTGDHSPWTTMIESLHNFFLGVEDGSIDISGGLESAGSWLGELFGGSFSDVVSKYASSAGGSIISILKSLGVVSKNAGIDVSHLREQVARGTMTMEEYNKAIKNSNANVKDGTIFGSLFGDTLDEVTDKFEGLGEGIEKAGGSAGKAKTEIDSLHDSLVSTLTSQLNLFDEYKKEDPMNPDQILKNMTDQINGMVSWAANMDKIAAMGIDQGLYQKLAEMGPQGAKYVSAFASMTAEQLQQANQLFATSLALPETVAGQVTNSFNNIGQNIISGEAAGILAGAEEFNAAIGTVQNGGFEEAKRIEEIASPSKRWRREIGMMDMLGLTEGFNDYRSLPIVAIEVMCMMVFRRAMTELSAGKFAQIGRQVPAGLKSGIESGTDELLEAVSSMARAAAEKARAALKIESPSKVFAEIGRYTDLGFAKGITDNANVVYHSVEDMADNAVNTMKMTIANISAQINDSFEDPVITPVLDLSNIQRGARFLQSTFSTNQALSAQAGFANLQNGNLNSSGNVVFNQYNTSPKALSRIDIYRDTRNLFAQAKGALS